MSGGLAGRPPSSRRTRTAPGYPALVAAALACTTAGCVWASVGEDPGEQVDPDAASVDPSPSPADSDAGGVDAADEAVAEPVADEMVAGCSVSPYESAPAAGWLVAAGAAALVLRRRRR